MVATYSLSDKCELLVGSSLFQNVPAAALEALARYAKIKSFKNREEICRRGELGSQLFIIARGKVSLHTDSDDGKELGFGFMGAGDIFGEIAVLAGGERTATVKAIEPTEIMVLEKRDLIPFLDKNPNVAIQLLATLAQRLRTTDEHFEDIFFRNLPGRLAKKFIDLARSYGEEVDDGVYIKLKLSQGEIGKLTGATRESVNKQMRAWENAGLIKCEKGFITITDFDALEDLSDEVA
ncbi:MAG: Crp/Fnr family transcriptional regulator [Gammaproteobacteria bacterium]|nr:Crp/Fnr family transcriptional regulator [Gammaproteobacteria bacterium]